MVGLRAQPAGVVVAGPAVGSRINKQRCFRGRKGDAAPVLGSVVDGGLRYHGS